MNPTTTVNQTCSRPIAVKRLIDQRVESLWVLESLHAFGGWSYVTAAEVGTIRQAVGQAGRRSSALRTKNASSASSPSGVMSAAILPIGSVPPSGCGKSVENA